MKKYIFKTTATMKPYNNKNWWIDGGIIPVKHIEAETVKDALQVSYVITGKTEFQKDSGEWVTQYIDLWVEIITTVETIF